MDTRKSYYRSKGDIPLLNTTIHAHFQLICERYPAQQAVVSLPQERELCYRELAGEIDGLAMGLLNMGADRGDKIGIWSTNNIEWLLVQMACARIGAVLVNINPAYRPTELSYALKLAEVKILFVIPSFRGSDYVEMLLELIPEIADSGAGSVSSSSFPSLAQVVLYDPARPMKTSSPAPGFTLWQQVVTSTTPEQKQKLEELSAGLSPLEAANIQFTSGTTGAPKAVVLSHHSILNNGYFTALAMHFTSDDRLAVSVPFYHCFGTVLANLLCFSCGAALVIPCAHFDPLQVLQAIEKERCTAVHGVPTMFIAMLDHPEFARIDTTSLRTGIMAGAPCPPQLMKRVMEEMHCGEILIGYGETEASPLTHLTTRDDSFERRTETVGRNLPHQEVKIIDTSGGEVVALGQIGEICFRGYHVMQGYYRNAEATTEAIDLEGWLHSGDLGTMDEKGYVRITGRLKNMIIRGGENIYPREIEECVFAHPLVAEVAIFGVPDDYWGEEIAAWIKLHPDSVCSADDIREFCRQQLAHFKTPRHIRFVREFPLTVTGKVQKFKMREEMIRELAATGK
ncbi:MAG: fatty acid CoA ligase family protein [Thermodesulfobacteriota bacterium]